MYNSKILANNIKNLAKKRGVLITTMLKDCKLNVNAINQISDKNGMSSFRLAKIADYLNCSVDYLLGRTNNPEINQPIFDVEEIIDDFENLSNKNQEDFIKYLNSLVVEQKKEFNNKINEEAN